MPPQFRDVHLALRFADARLPVGHLGREPSVGRLAPGARLERRRVVRPADPPQADGLDGAAAGPAPRRDDHDVGRIRVRKKRRISIPAMKYGWSPSGRQSTGSVAMSRTSTGATTFDAFEWASTATRSKRPVSTCIAAAATAWSPSPPTVCTGLWTAPSWSGVYSSKMAVPSAKSSDAVTKLPISAGSTPASA